ncbi:MAG: thioredoxin-dependent peroxiredoxin [Bacillales bacterium]
MSYCDRPKTETALEEVKEELILENKEEIKNMILVGNEAPLFKAAAYHNGEFKMVDLKEFRGKWVMLCFYPGDFTFVCGTEVSTIASKYEEFQKLNTEIISVSVDSQFVHKIWNDNELKIIAKRDIPFPMVSDTGGVIGSLYGVYDGTSGVDVRGRFLIDPDGVIQAMEILTPPVGRNANEALRQIKAYQYVRENPSEVTPAGWVPGKTTLKPGIDLVGNVYKTWTIEELEK